MGQWTDPSSTKYAEYEEITYLFVADKNKNKLLYYNSFGMSSWNLQNNRRITVKNTFSY
jgi:hypothetical protein